VALGDEVPICRGRFLVGTIFIVEAFNSAAAKAGFAVTQGSPSMVRPELHYVPRPYMDSTGYKEAVREVYAGAQPIERKHERSAARRGYETDRPSLKRAAA
jgi:hypothetical protein